MYHFQRCFFFFDLVKSELSCQTLEFAQMCERCGIDALIVHARRVADRPAHAAQWDQFKVLNLYCSIGLR